MKTLYIKIDSNSLPEGCGEDIEVLDCRCINDFCSLVGDALVGDLKDEIGTPYYRLYSPVGNLLIEFKKYNPNSFESLISNWYNILADILQNGDDGSETINITLSKDCYNWLIMHENEQYVAMGKN